MTNAPGGTDRLPADRVEVFPMAVGSYDAHEPLPVDPEVRAVMSAMADFGTVEVPWTVSMHDRGGDAVDERLRDWSEPARPTDTILYWVGHGWSDGLDVSLAHARSPAAVRTSGVLPQRMAEALRARQATSWLCQPELAPAGRVELAPLAHAVRDDVLVRAVVVDPRDQRWKDDSPAYRVYLWRDDTQCEEWQLTEADIDEVLAWADVHADGRTMSVWVVRGDAEGLGLIRLAGVDPPADPSVWPSWAVPRR